MSSQSQNRNSLKENKCCLFSLSLSFKKKLLNCLKKSDSDLQKSFLLVCLATVRRTDPYNGMSEGLIQISIEDWKINRFSPNVVVNGLFQCQFLILKVRSRPPFSLFHEEYLCYTPSPHPNERKHEDWATLTHLWEKLLPMSLGILRYRHLYLINQ